MKHWNFFPCLLLLLAVFWWRFVDLRLEEMKIEGTRPKIEIRSIIDEPMNFGAPKVPPLILPPENTPFFDPHGPNSAEKSFKSGKTNI